MRPIWKFIIFNVISIILTISIYAIGYEYDRENILYPEAYYFSYDASIIVYGKRWERIAQTLAITLAIMDVL